MFAPLLLISITSFNQIDRQLGDYKEIQAVSQVRTFLGSTVELLRLVRSERASAIQYALSKGLSGKAVFQETAKKVGLFRQKARTEFRALQGRGLLKKAFPSIKNISNALNLLDKNREKIKSAQGYPTYQVFTKYNDAIDALLLVLMDISLSISQADIHHSNLIWLYSLTIEELISRQHDLLTMNELLIFETPEKLASMILIINQKNELKKELNLVWLSVEERMKLDKNLSAQKVSRLTPWEGHLLSAFKNGKRAGQLSAVSFVVDAMKQDLASIIVFNRWFYQSIANTTEAEIKNIYSAFTRIVLILLILVCVMGVTIYCIAIRGFVYRIRIVAQCLKAWEVKKQEFPRFNVDGRDEVGIVAAALNGLIDKLEIYHDELEDNRQELKQTHDELLVKQKKQADEERVAKDVFSRIIRSSDKIDGVGVWSRPFSTFSGDLVLSVKDSSGATHCLLCDFTGHGLPAALGAVPVSAIYRAMVNRGMSGSAVIDELNDKLKELLPTEYFCCAAYAIIDHQNQQAEIWNCGLPAIIVVNEAGNIRTEIEPSNLPLGIVKVSTEYEMSNISFASGDSIYLCTDGITEAENMQGEMLGQAAYLQLLQVKDRGFGRLKDIETSITQYMGKAPPSDDMSLVEIRFSG